MGTEDRLQVPWIVFLSWLKSVLSEGSTGHNPGPGWDAVTSHTWQVQLHARRWLSSAHGTLVDVPGPVPGLAGQRGADEHPAERESW